MIPHAAACEQDSLAEGHCRVCAIVMMVHMRVNTLTNNLLNSSSIHRIHHPTHTPAVLHVSSHDIQVPARRRGMHSRRQGAHCEACDNGRCEGRCRDRCIGVLLTGCGGNLVRPGRG